jgi:hypothetical protein
MLTLVFDVSETARLADVSFISILLTLIFDIGVLCISCIFMPNDEPGDMHKKAALLRNGSLLVLSLLPEHWNY